MKKKLEFTLVGLIVLIVITMYAPDAVTAREVSPEEIIRLHVIANSDNKEDQALKLKVRDEIVTMLRPNLLKAKDRAGAEAILVDHLAEIEEIAQDKVDSEGFSYPVNAVIGDFDFPIKAYNDFIAPAGNYRALKVIIGEGAGANWWCVMFPPICFVDLKHQVTADTDTALAETIDVASAKTVQDLTKEDKEETEETEQEVEIEVRFKIVELWQSLTDKFNSLF